MMAEHSRDPYERMLSDAVESIQRVHDAVHAMSLDLNTAKSERATIFRHLDQMREDITTLKRLAHGDGNGIQGYGDRLRSLEGRGGRWVDAAKVLGQIAVGFAAALSLYLQLSGG